jgi:hypothetical protein
MDWSFQGLQMHWTCCCRLDLPPGMRIHNVFHASLVKPYRNDGSFKPLDSSIQDDMDGDPIFEVEKILDSRIRKVGSRQVTEYKIRWANFPPIHDSWEPSKNIIDKNLIKDFLSGRPAQLPGT